MNKQLTTEQMSVVKSMIVSSMKNGFSNAGKPIPDGFTVVSGRIADTILHNTQMALIQGSVFEKVLKEDKNKKVAKKVVKSNKKVVKKVNKKK